MNARRRTLVALGALALLQAAIWTLYRTVESRRVRGVERAAAAYERIAGSAQGREAPLELPDGSQVRLASYDGDSVILHFWASWCAPCRAELPALMALAQERPWKSELVFLFVSVDESWASVRHFFGGEVPPGVVRDGSGALKQAFGLTTLPETYGLRPGGLLSARWRGARDWSSSEARETLAAWLGSR